MKRLRYVAALAVLLLVALGAAGCNQHNEATGPVDVTGYQKMAAVSTIRRIPGGLSRS